MDIFERNYLGEKLGYSLNNQGYLEVPNSCNKLKIDVGLSYDAPNALNWLRADPSVFVLGIEPIIEQVHSLKIQLSKCKQELIPRFAILNCALGEFPNYMYLNIPKNMENLVF